MFTRFDRVYLLAITLLLCACNDYEAAQRGPSSAEQAQSIEASVEAMANAGFSIENAQPVNLAPTGQGFSIAANTQTETGGQTPRHLSDSRQAISLVGSANHEAESTALGSVWAQRDGEQAVLLNADSENAIALLPQVAAPTQLTFGFIAANTAGFIGEQHTTIDVLPSDAPFAVDTSTQYQQAAQVLLNVSLNAPASETVTLRYSTSDATALANRDYLPSQGELTFEPGQRSLIVSVPLLGSAAATPNTDDRYFKLLVAGELGTFKGTVRGYGVILSETAPGNSAQSISESTITQDALAGSAGEQRVHLARPSSALRLSVSIRCAEAGNSCLDNTNSPRLESGELWQNISVPTRLEATQRYMLTNTSAAALAYTAYVFDGDIRREITGQIAANSQILVYTAFAAPVINTSSSNSTPNSSSSVANSSASENSSSSQAALIAHTLNITAKPQGIDAVALTLQTTFNDDIAINNLSAALNGNNAQPASGQEITIAYEHLNSGINYLTVSASDAAGTTLVRELHLYYGAEAENNFIGDGPTNIFIGQQGADSFTGGDGTNIYIPGTGATEFISGSGQNIFIHQLGALAMSLTAPGTTDDAIILPTASLAQASIRQGGESHIYIVAASDEAAQQSSGATSSAASENTPLTQNIGIYDYFTGDGTVQSSIQRFVFADGELTASDIRRLVHTAAPGNSAYWGFSGDDILIDTDGDDAAFGGAGNDTIHVNGYAEGGDGNDVITARHGEGGTGNDEIHAISNATGGDGDDILYTQDFAQGEAGNDILHGNDDDNQLFGGLGDDTLYGYGGDDGLFGDEGNNTFYGGDGDDSIFAAQGEFNDILFGGDGNDLLWGYDGDNYYDGGNGDETFFAGHGNNTIICGEGNHSIFGTDAGNDTITCGSGIDEIFIEDGNDDVDSGGGNDQIYGDSGNKNIITGEGDDEIRINSGDNCTIAAGAGDDVVYTSCNRLVINGDAGNDTLVVTGTWQLEVTGGLGDDEIRLSGRPPYQEPLEQPAQEQTSEPSYTHIFWAPGDGNDIYTISGYNLNDDNNALTKTNTDESANTRAMQAVAELSEYGLPGTRFYLGGSATLEGLRFEQSDVTSLLMHYHDATTGLDETVTFNYWFNSRTGLSASEKFYDFVLPDLSSITTSSISAHFNNLFYRNFDNSASGFSAFGTPMASDKVVINDISMVIDSENFLIRDELALDAASWTLEFWVAIPDRRATTTPILQWGESAFGSDGFGLALIDSGEGMYWSLMNGETHSVENYNFKYNVDDGGDAQHIALVYSNNALTLYINGEPCTGALAIEYEPIPKPLSLGYLNLAGELNSESATRWYLDELLINYSSAKYSGAFTPQAMPFDIDFVPASETDAPQ